MVGGNQRRALGRAVALVRGDIEYVVKEVQRLGIGLGRADDQKL